MQIKSIVAAAAIALAATIGSASAADQFTTLDGIAAQPLTQQEMGKWLVAILQVATNLDPSGPNQP